MFDRLEIFQLATARARHAAARQAVVAQNIANADTPGYRAREVSDFAEMWRRMDAGNAAGPLPIRTMDANTPASPNGNTVSLELEMLRGIDAQRDHDRAVRVYDSALNILRSSLGRR
ncbi:Flagellar basal-body rod protein FlgB [Roseibacterium elongatum DSM 19469]|uniref:Flagellar basal-body rod protein FlgB n=1 Tax=Roseicyclus elongatus DSM 19469 TaxID=1294273 RepID=W8RR94_9RHOB|nr:FlgB family protein [Roseibacterium elongatum]AHM03704.1 Flagellar basal-body rod protein FlgB [Roseibacterium elongatum DSM 19469]